MVHKLLYTVAAFAASQGEVPPAAPVESYEAEATDAASITQSPDVTESCDERVSGEGMSGYRGCQDRTVSGLQCQRWDSQTPHSHKYDPERYDMGMPIHGLEENYCRNPGHQEHSIPRIWCYTIDKATRWDFCSPLGTDVGASPLVHTPNQPYIENTNTCTRASEFEESEIGNFPSELRPGMPTRLECKQGYNGSITLTCQKDGDDYTVESNCDKNSCRRPEATSNWPGANLPRTFVTGGEKIDCKEGYLGEVTLTCDTNNEHYCIDYGCVESVCTIPDLAVTGVTLPSAFTTGELSPQCDSGFAGRVILKCPAPGKYEVDSTCRAETCDIPDDVSEYVGVDLPATYTHGTKSPKCSKGFHGHVTLECPSSKNPYSINSTCTPNICSKTTTVHEGVTLPQHYETGSDFPVCDTGYEGSVQIDCPYHNKPYVVTEEPGCIRNDCTRKEGLDLVSASYPEVFTTGDEPTVECNEGYNGGIKKMKCPKADEDYTFVGTCTKNFCTRDPLYLSRLEAEYPEDFTTGGPNRIACSKGYASGMTISCPRHNKFYHIEGTCAPIAYVKCQGVKAPKGANEIYPNNWQTEDAQPLSCKEGYEGTPTIVGDDTTRCFTVENPCTAMTYFPDPKNPQEPYVEGVLPSSLTTGDNTRFKCQVGYNGAVTLVANDDTELFTIDGGCHANECSAPIRSGLHAGFDLPAQFVTNASAQPTCNEGFHGDVVLKCPVEGPYQVVNNCKVNACKRAEKYNGSPEAKYPREFTHGDEPSLKCNTGYGWVLTGYGWVHDGLTLSCPSTDGAYEVEGECKPNVWKRPVPVNAPENTQDNYPETFTTGDKQVVECDTGYEGMVTVSGIDGEEYYRINSTCSPITWKKPADFVEPDHVAEIAPLKYTTGDDDTLDCEKGYTPGTAGPVTIHGEDGEKTYTESGGCVEIVWKKPEFCNIPANTNGECPPTFTVTRDPNPIKCKPGYGGKVTIVAVDGDEYYSLEGSCRALTCTRSSSLDAAAYPSDFVTGQEVRCNAGYHGPITLTCETSGPYVVAKGSCEPNECNIGEAYNTRAYPGKYTTAVPEKCNTGYLGEPIFSCRTHNGRYDVISGTCTPMKWPLSKNACQDKVGELGKYPEHYIMDMEQPKSCDVGYNGKITLSGVENNKFYHCQGQCLPNSWVRPAELTPPSNSKPAVEYPAIFTTGDDPNSVKCASGYEGTVIISGTDGEEEYEVSGRCTAITWDRPQPVNGPANTVGVYPPTYTTGDDQAEDWPPVKCKPGYRGTVSISGIDGNDEYHIIGACPAICWKQPLTTYESRPANSDVDLPAEWCTGDEQPLKCSKGHKGTLVISGVDTEENYSVSGECVPITWLKPGNYQDTPGMETGFPAKYTFGFAQPITCAEGYSGPVTIKGEDQQKFYSTDGACSPNTCRKPEKPIKGLNNNLPETYTTDTNHPKCDQGYIGSVTLSCADPALPYEVVSNCTGICEPQNSPCDNGVCEVKSEGLFYVATCNCENTAFVGEHCETPKCDVFGCKNGGVCEISEWEPVCRCEGTGFLGLKCDESVCNEKHSPCLNGCPCEVRNFAPTCRAQGSGFVGPFCKEGVCEGANNPCVRGVCDVDAGTGNAVCTCTGTGYNGPTCEAPLKCVKPVNASVYIGVDLPVTFITDVTPQPACRPGYDGEVTVTCLIEGHGQPYNVQAITCQPIVYPAPPAPLLLPGVIGEYPTEYHTDGPQPLSCAEGYHGDIKIVAPPGSTYYTTDGECIPNRCDRAANYADRDEASYPVSYTTATEVDAGACKEGYHGKVSLKCATHGGKYEVLETCEANACTKPTNLNRRSVSWPTSFTTGDNAVFSCKKGYVDPNDAKQVNGHGIVTLSCKDHGAIYEVDGECRDVCDDTISQCENNGRCSRFRTPKKYSKTFRCSCRGTGFAGKFCNISICDPEFSPCQNGCACSVSNTKEAVCDSTGTEYRGATCETHMCEGKYNPCQHKSTCLVEPGLVPKHKCDCSKTTYQGEVCEIDRCGAELNPCKNGSTCSFNANYERVCICSQTPFHGPVCDIPNTCVRPLSLAHDRYPNKFTHGEEVTCQEGYTGDSIELECHENGKEYLWAGGDCKPCKCSRPLELDWKAYPNQYATDQGEVKCNKGYVGSIELMCKMQGMEYIKIAGNCRSPCDFKKCLHGGVCFVDGADEAKCNCSETNYEGENCETERKPVQCTSRDIAGAVKNAGRRLWPSKCSRGLRIGEQTACTAICKPNFHMEYPGSVECEGPHQVTVYNPECIEREECFQEMGFNVAGEIRRIEKTWELFRCQQHCYDDEHCEFFTWLDWNGSEEESHLCILKTAEGEVDTDTAGYKAKTGPAECAKKIPEYTEVECNFGRFEDTCASCGNDVFDCAGTSPDCNVTVQNGEKTCADRACVLELPLAECVRRKNAGFCEFGDNDEDKTIETVAKCSAVCSKKCQVEVAALEKVLPREDAAVICGAGENADNCDTCQSRRLCGGEGDDAPQSPDCGLNRNKQCLPRACTLELPLDDCLERKGQGLCALSADAKFDDAKVVARVNETVSKCAAVCKQSCLATLTGVRFSRGSRGQYGRRLSSVEPRRYDMRYLENSAVTCNDDTPADSCSECGELNACGGSSTDCTLENNTCVERECGITNELVGWCHDEKKNGNCNTEKVANLCAAVCSSNCTDSYRQLNSAPISRFAQNLLRWKL